ncbi:hypothetical protein GCM10020221_31880 [Streptomyces thioluteus]|uniref:Uncharacterized protein n=1 Tax=Streptomyces thioluteus TaxID=66431 RepID=A0ABN3X244_STRTU
MLVLSELLWINDVGLHPYAQSDADVGGSDHLAPTLKIPEYSTACWCARIENPSRAKRGILAPDAVFESHWHYRALDYTRPV